MIEHVVRTSDEGHELDYIDYDDNSGGGVIGDGVETLVIDKSLMTLRSQKGEPERT